MYGIVTNIIIRFMQSFYGIARSGSNVVLSAASGGVITTGSWLQNTPGLARQTADATNATTTFASLTDLSVSVLAGRKYIGKLILKVANSTATEGIKIDLAGGTVTATSIWAAASSPVGGTTVLGTAISTSLAGVINYTTITGATIIEVNISMVVNAAGTFIPRIAENTTAIGTLTVSAGSYLILDDSPN